jgi:hypothetical protein
MCTWLWSVEMVHLDGKSSPMAVYLHATRDKGPVKNGMPSRRGATYGHSEFLNGRCSEYWLGPDGCHQFVRPAREFGLYYTRGLLQGAEARTG